MSEITVRLPDGTEKKFDKGIMFQDIAADIGPGLAKASLAATANGETLDMTRTLDADADVTFITQKSEPGLEIIRHSCAHILAMAVQRLWPGTQVTIGPVIEDGFYYDFAFGRAFTPDDLTRIEAKMQEIAKQINPNIL